MPSSLTQTDATTLDAAIAQGFTAKGTPLLSEARLAMLASWAAEQGVLVQSFEAYLLDGNVRFAAPELSNHGEAEESAAAPWSQRVAWSITFVSRTLDDARQAGGDYGFLVWLSREGEV